MNLAVQKAELIKWINSIEDPNVLNELEEIKSSSFDFEKEWEKAITIDEARKKTKKFIKLLPWKK